MYDLLYKKMADSARKSGVFYRNFMIVWSLEFRGAVKNLRIAIVFSGKIKYNGKQKVCLGKTLKEGMEEVMWRSFW